MCSSWRGGGVLFDRGTRRAEREAASKGVHFVQSVRDALRRTREEANRLHHEYIGTEHLLLAVTSQPDGEAARILTGLGLDLDQIREQVEAVAGRGRSSRARGGELPYTSRAKKVLELAIDEARRLGHDWVGVEHLLLGVLREEKGAAGQVLGRLGVTLDDARAAILGQRGSGPAWPESFRVQIDDASEQSIYEQIIAQVQEAMATGRLRPGDRLPPVRQLADRLDIAPGTVARAYGDLERQ